MREITREKEKEKCIYPYQWQCNSILTEVTESYLSFNHSTFYNECFLAPSRTVLFFINYKKIAKYVRILKLTWTFFVYLLIFSSYTDTFLKVVRYSWLEITTSEQYFKSLKKFGIMFILVKIWSCKGNQTWTVEVMKRGFQQSRTHKRTGYLCVIILLTHGDHRCYTYIRQ